MLKFQEESLRQSVNGALALRHQINPFLDAIFEKGITNICFLGIGGTYASAMQTVSHMKEFTSRKARIVACAACAFSMALTISGVLPVTDE